MAQDPEVQEEGVEEAAPKKSNKKLIIIIAAVLVLALGGGAGWFFMSKGDAEHGEEGEEHHEEEVVHAEPVFLKLDTFTVNLNPEEGEKFLQTDITLSASSQEEADLLTAQMPQVRSRVLMLLTSKLPSEVTSKEGKEGLIYELIDEVNEPYSEDAEALAVSDAFFTSFVIQ